MSKGRKDKIGAARPEASETTAGHVADLSGGARSGRPAAAAPDEIGPVGVLQDRVKLPEKQA